MAGCAVIGRSGLLFYPKVDHYPNSFLEDEVYIDEEEINDFPIDFLHR